MPEPSVAAAFWPHSPAAGRSSSMSLSPVPARGCTIRACKLEGPGEGTDSLTINNLTVTHRMSGPGYSKSGPWSSGICVTWELVLSLKSYQDVLYQNLHWNKIPRRFECTVSLYFSHLFPRWRARGSFWQRSSQSWWDRSPLKSTSKASHCTG